MPKAIDMAGKRFGRLTANSPDKDKPGYWLCRCDCGETKSVRGTHLRQGRSRSCGCSSQDSLIDITGQKFGRLAVIARAKNIGERTAWVCLCDCGNTSTVPGDALKRGNTRSCGCLHRNITSEIGKANRKHGMFGTRTYRSWAHMIERCGNQNAKDFGNYGGRGITVCERWRSFENFLSDMGEAKQGMTIERDDVNGNYDPQNCRWATRKEQSRNTRRSRKNMVDGKQITLAEMCEISGLKNETLRNRIDRGWSVEDAMSTPAGQRRLPKPSDL